MTSPLHIAVLIVLVLALAYWYHTRVERLETINSTFYDSLKDRAADYYYDPKGMTLADYGLESKALGLSGDSGM